MFKILSHKLLNALSQLISTQSDWAHTVTCNTIIIQDQQLSGADPAHP